VNRFPPQPPGPRPARPRPRLRAAALALAALSAAAVAAGCAAPVARPPAPVASGTPASTQAPAAAGAHAASTAAAPACNPDASSLAPLPGPPQVTPGSFMAKIKARGHLIAGVDANTYHFEYFNPRDANFEGFDIDMIRAVAQAIFGNPNAVQYKALTNDERIPDVNNGSVDIVAHTMTITCARLKDVDFSTVYFDAHQQILVLDGSTVTGAASLAGQKVCATKGATSIGNIEPYHPIIVQVQYNTDCLVKLQQGQVAAITTDNSILEGLEAQDPYTKIVGPYLTDEPYGLAIAKTHPDFVRFVNAVLENERTSGAWKASYVKWVGSPAPQPPPAGYAS
jgi:polar amino acid transport system substrate-binding protein